jgi:5-hydroxyisourate hydrolase
MSTISTHILDIARGRPASGITVILRSDNREFARARTDDNGRITTWTANSDPDAADPVASRLSPGGYTLRFETRPYFKAQSLATLYPFIEIHFEVGDDSHYHIPLLLSPWGYSTYRGS